jgi:hypothetical protein
MDNQDLSTLIIARAEGHWRARLALVLLGLAEIIGLAAAPAGLYGLWVLKRHFHW